MVPGSPDPLYVIAREVLLDALAALGHHRTAVVLVGAQAIYLHTGAADLAVAETTTDGDLAIEPAALGGHPLLEAALKGADFSPGVQPGSWVKDRGDENSPAVRVDLMVPEALSGGGRRGARLGVHGNRAARKTRGLEAAIVDNEVRTIAALGSGDPRSFDIRVANPSALLIAKLHKLGERVERADRVRDKDALDILRILRTFPEAELAGKLRELQGSQGAGEVTTEAMTYLPDLFGSVAAAGTQALIRATAGLEDEGTISASVVALSTRLIEAYENDGPP